MIDFIKSYFDFNALNRFAFFNRYIALLILSSIIIAIDRQLLIEVNQGSTIVPFHRWSDQGLFFKKIVHFISFLLFWLSVRRFKHMLNVESLSTFAFALFLLLYLISNRFELSFIIAIILSMLPSKKRKQ